MLINLQYILVADICQTTNNEDVQIRAQYLKEGLLLRCLEIKTSEKNGGNRLIGVINRILSTYQLL